MTSFTCVSLQHVSVCECQTMRWCTLWHKAEELAKAFECFWASRTCFVNRRCQVYSENSNKHDCHMKCTGEDVSIDGHVSPNLLKPCQLNVVLTDCCSKALSSMCASTWCQGFWAIFPIIMSDRLLNIVIYLSYQVLRSKTKQPLSVEVAREYCSSGWRGMSKSATEHA